MKTVVTYDAGIFQIHEAAVNLFLSSPDRRMRMQSWVVIIHWGTFQNCKSPRRSFGMSGAHSGIIGLDSRKLSRKDR